MSGNPAPQPTSDVPWRLTDFRSASADGCIYVDTAGRSALPTRVERTGLEALPRKATPWRGLGDDGVADDVRTLFAELIHAPSSDCVAFAPATSTALSVAAANAVRTGVLGPGKAILLLDNEMGSAVYPWQDACRQSGAALKVVPTPPLGSSWADAVIAAVDGSVAVVAVPHVHWCDGSLVDLEAIARHLDTRPGGDRPLLVVDATQSLGALPFDVAAVRPSYLCASTHKWLCGPYGLSLVYLAPELHATWTPIDHHERSREGSDNPAWDEHGAMAGAHGYPEPFFPGARRLDGGGRANPTIMPMVREALRCVLEWTPAAIQRRLSGLTAYFLAQLHTVEGCTALEASPGHLRCGHIVGLRFAPSITPGATAGAEMMSHLNARLKQHKVIASVRSGYLRVAPYVYNTSAEMAAVARLVAQLAAEVSSTTAAAGSVAGLPRPPPATTLLREVAAAAAANHSVRPFTVLVTGSTGWLGQFVCRAFAAHPTVTADGPDGPFPGAPLGAAEVPIEVYGGYHSSAPEWVPEERRVKVELGDAAAVDEVIQRLRPDAVLHLAALSSPAVCHKDPALARAVNCPTHLVDAVRRHVPHCLLVFTSTDLVYDGEGPPYVADPAAPPRPGTVYGETKLAFEHEVLSLPNGVVLRLSNMIGPRYAYRPAGAKFMQWLHESYVRRDAVALRHDEVRSFLHVDDVVEVLCRAVRRAALHALLSPTAAPAPLFDGYRVFNVGGSTGLSRLGLGTLLAEASGATLAVVDTSTSTSTSSPSAADPAVWAVKSSSNAESIVATGIHNPRDVTMDSAATERTFGFKFTPTRTAVTQIVRGFEAAASSM